MARIWSREHLVRRVDRYYLLAAAAKLPNLRQRYLHLARLYRKMLSLTPLSLREAQLPLPN